MPVFFVESLCLDDIEGMNEEMAAQEALGADVLLVDDLWEVPKGATYYDGVTIRRN